MSLLKGLAAKLFPNDALAKEFDPELDAPFDDDDDDSQKDGADNSSDDSEAEDARDIEHYVEVGKSKLRQRQPLELGLAYRGKRVSRAELEEGNVEEDENSDGDQDEPFADPDTVDLDDVKDVDSEDEIDSDDAFGPDDDTLVKSFTFRGSSKPRITNGVEEEDEEDDGDEEGSGVQEGGTDEDSDVEYDDSSEEEEDDHVDTDEPTAMAQAETRKLLAQDQQQMLASLSQSAKADADKGFAVRQQRRAFDALLNVRIRLQKALTAANSLHVAADAGNDAATATVAEVSAETVALLDTLQSVRRTWYGDVGGVRTRKRDRCEDLFDEMAAAEEAALAKRRKVLDRWSQRVQAPRSAGPAMAGSHRGGTATSTTQPLLAVLDGQLATAPERTEGGEDAEIYDDADFYQRLLKELVDQRAAGGSGGPGGSGAATVQWAATVAVRAAKTRKQVDRRASKGRKMRFQVHEKLQNFMAPEDRRAWEPEAVDRLFSTLFGQRLGLREDTEVDDAHVDDSGKSGIPLQGVSLF